MTAQNRCPSCGGFLYAGSLCPICQSDAAGSADDFDFLTTESETGRHEARLELENALRLSAPPPGMLAAPPVPSERPRTITPPPAVRPANATSRTDRTSSRPIAGPDAVVAYAKLPPPSDAFGASIAYFVRVWSRRARLLEKATLLRRSARGVAVDLETRYAKLGQALYDEPNEVRRYPALAPLAESTRLAAEALSAAVKARAARSEHSDRAKDLAASRLERASAGLDPVEEIEREAREAMAAANEKLVTESEALALLESALRADVNEGRTDAETLSRYDRDIDAQKARLVAAERAQRDAALKASEARRRVLVEASRIAEAKAAVDSAELARKAERRAADREEHAAADAFHAACAELGRAGFDLAAGQTLKGTFWDARKTRDAHDAVIRHAELAENARNVHDAALYERGRRATIALGVLVLAALLVVAAS